ncbi:hypothetical protein EV179_000616 [Coemansia sp. RSA 487]|nr:hypothetical protein LPJ74_004682 [Coemansia sp. RSA 1843]KAJ2217149.1 hypothetical protein EV179_000616 [Coemansia sp. RSA 487]
MTPIQRPMLPKLDIPVPNFIPEIEGQVWVPNPLVSKLSSIFSVTPTYTPSSVSGTSGVYCSQCKRYYPNPTVFFNHIYNCN